MLKRLRKQFGKLREIPTEERVTRLLDAKHITMQDAVMIEESDPHKRLRKLCEYMGIENVIAAFPMPMGVAEHFKVNGREISAIPMVTEERTVIAAASKAAKLCSEKGFLVEFGNHVVQGQVLLELPPTHSGEELRDIETALIRDADTIIQVLKSTDETFTLYGGGILGFTPRVFRNSEGNFARITIHVHPGEAMGARGVTKIAKALGEVLTAHLDWKPCAWICLNDNPHQTVTVEAFWPESNALSQETLATVARNSEWAASDPARAITHNKGIMNAVDAIGLATAQDTRAIEAGAWADAYRSGFCKPLSHFWKVDGGIRGELKMQLTAGTVGGATSHPFAKLSHRLMSTETSADLMCVMGAVALAQNFAALAWALDT